MGHGTQGQGGGGGVVRNLGLGQYAETQVYLTKWLWLSLN